MNFSLGVTYEPVRAFRFTVDGYEVHLSDRIVKTDLIGTANNGGGAVKNLLVANGVLGSTARSTSRTPSTRRPWERMSSPSTR